MVLTLETGPMEKAVFWIGRGRGEEAHGPRTKMQTINQISIPYRPSCSSSSNSCFLVQGQSQAPNATFEATARKKFQLTHTLDTLLWWR